jgi:hypothetical protein
MRFKAQLVDYFLANKDSLSISEISKKIFEDENGIDLSEGTIKNYLYTIRNEQTTLFTTDNLPDWRVQDGKYLFERSNTIKVFSVALVDQIFLYYSRRGYNFTRTGVSQRFKLTPKTFRDLQNVFHLSKDSDIVSPHTKNSLSKDEFGDLLETLQNEVVNSGEMTSKKMSQALERKYRSVIDVDNKDHIWRNTVISEILDTNFEKIRVPSTVETSGRYYEMDWNITDIHSGSKSEKMKITADWSIEKLVETLDRASIIINSYGCGRNHLNFLGDLVETVSGVNHPDSWKLVQDGHFGSKAIIEAYKVIAEFIGKVNNVSSVNGVGGNHDRLQASNKLADTGASDLIFFMLSQHLEGSDIPVNYDPVVLAFERKGYGVMLGHGDKGIHKRGMADQILLLAINPKQFQFINTGHLHTLIIKDSQCIGRLTVNPSIITGNPFSDISIGKSDKSGITANCVNMFDEPVQIVENL